MEPTKYGLIVEPIVPEKDFVLGGYNSIGGRVLQEDGQWTDWLPPIESQANTNGFDAIACASFGTLNSLEILARRLYGQNRNWSDRFLAKVSETTPQGNSPHKVAETLRKLGAPNEVDYPYSPTIKTWDEFYADIPKAIYSLAIAFLAEFDFKHEYVVPQPDYLKQALKYSPLGISVCAWFQQDGIFYKPQGMQDNHWVTLIGYKENEYWLVFDSYAQGDSFIKKVKWNTPFQIAKRYSLERQIVNEKSWLLFLIDLIKAAFGVEGAAVTVDHTVPPAPSPASKYDWSTPLAARHSTRVICDEEGLSWNAKNIITACIMQESRFNPKAVNNANANGTSDYGLCQYNTGKNSKGQPYWIGPGADFASIEEVLNNPEKNVRVMIREYKKGNIKLWASYSTGAYKKWL